MSSTTGRVPRGVGLAGVLAAATVLGLLLASPARADFDITNTWIISFRDGGGNLLAECEWAFDQTAEDLEASGLCGPTAFAHLVGTIDPVTGVFDLAGTLIVLELGAFPIEMSGSVAPDGLALSGTHSLEPGGSFTGRLCGNRHLDPGESCDEGTSSPGCCTPACDFKPDGVACSSPCQTATTCTSGVCSGVPKPAGTTCDPDANSCTKDACDAAGACIVGPCSPCCTGSSCTAAPRSCKRPVDGAATVLVKSTLDGRRNRVRFKIGHAEATAEEDVGDPTASSDYQLCVYTIGGPAETPAFLFDATVPAGPSWTRTRDGGARYRRPDHAPDGLTSIRIAPGAEGAASVKVTGGGPLLDVPFPVGPVPGGELTVQLGHAGACWGAAFLLDSNSPFLLKATQSFD
jgi:hypothetical protein